MKHTSGPLEWDSTNPTGWLIGKNGASIMHIDTDLVEGPNKDDRRLIETAPELLAALIALVNTINTTSSEYDEAIRESLKLSIEPCRIRALSASYTGMFTHWRPSWKQKQSTPSYMNSSRH